MIFLIKLYNGDFVEQSSKNIKNNSIDVIITDPPFGVGFKNDFYDDSLEYIMRNIDNWYKEWFRVLKNNSFLFLFVGVKTLHIWIQKGIEAGFEYKNVLATRSFNNGAITPKNNFGFQFQPIIVFSKGKGKNFNKVDFIPTSEEWLNDTRNTNPKPYTYSYPNWIKTEWCFASAKRSDDNLHPNEKNVDLIQFLVEISTKKGEVVLDTFMGSCSTGVAAIEAERSFVGIELDTNYHKFSIERLKSRTNLFNFEEMDGLE